MIRFTLYLINWAASSTLILFLFEFLYTTGASNIIDLDKARSSMCMLLLVYFIICFLLDRPVNM